VRQLLEAPRRGTPKAIATLKLEKELNLTDEDRHITSAGIPRWRHALLNLVANLRARELMVAHDSENADYWALTTSGIKWARAQIK
jgi:hypothetical protein